MSLDVAKLIEENEKFHEFQGRKAGYLYFPCQKPSGDKKLFVSFGAVGGNYNRIRGYYEELSDEYDLLYLANKGQYYLADQGDFGVEALFTNLLEKIISESGVAGKDIYFLGSSMGGFAALYYGYKFEVGKVVALCPLVGIEALYKEQHPDLYKVMITDMEYDLDSYIFKMFDKTVPTECHIAFCREDVKVCRADTAKLIGSFIRNQNMFTVESYDIKRNAEGRAHASIAYLLTPDKVMALFAKSMRAEVVFPEKK